MFPMFPYNNLKNFQCAPGAVASYITGSSQLLVPGRVTATTKMHQGSMSMAIDPSHLNGQPDIQQLSVGMDQYGTIALNDSCLSTWPRNIHWVRAIRLSDDCHSYNVQLRLLPSKRPSVALSKTLPTPKLVLQAVRPIEIGQELLLWFSEDILAMLQIVFLTPANIQGQKKYVCMKCLTLYECPNPLKLHISLACGRYTITSLWEKLSRLITESNIFFRQETFDFKLNEPQIYRQKTAIDLTTSLNQKNNNENQKNNNEDQKNSADNSKIPFRPYSSETSAFKPFIKEDNPTGTSPLREIPTVWPSMLEPPGRPIIQNFLLDDNGINYNDESHIESLVSTLGKSKQGHICLYCGKCYSRKYGLKIHIRTHTGYKPLKCKFCSRPFGDPSNLNKHVRLHAEGNTPYKCELCGKILVRRRDLERHLKSRHMIEMHPDLNILPDSPSPSNDSNEEEIIDMSDEDNSSKQSFIS